MTRALAGQLFACWALWGPAQYAVATGHASGDQQPVSASADAASPVASQGIDALVGRSAILDELIVANGDGTWARTRLLRTAATHASAVRVLRVEDLFGNHPNRHHENDGQRFIARQVSVAGVYLVTLKVPANEEQLHGMLAPFDVRLGGWVRRRSVYQVYIAADTKTARRNPAVAALRQLPEVAAVDNDYLIEATAAQPDPLLAEQWHLENSGKNGGLVDADIDGVEAWSLTDCSSLPVIAVIDTGIDATYADLANNIWRNPMETAAHAKPDVDDDCNGYKDDIAGWDFIDNDNNAINYGESHATEVAEIIAAIRGNTEGGAGICSKAQIMNLRATQYGVGSADLASVVNAMDYAIAQEVAVINASWGMKCWGGTDCPPVSLMRAVEDAGRKGILVVTGAGNSREDIDQPETAFYPASLAQANVITAAATDSRDNRWRSSNYGKSHVDLAAPGEGIFSPYLEHLNPGHSRPSNGTSYAAAMVSGAALMVIDHCHLTDPDQIKSQLRQSVDARAGLSNVTQWGGRLNVCRAICACSGAADSADCKACEDQAGDPAAAPTSAVPTPTIPLPIGTGDADRLRPATR